MKKFAAVALAFTLFCGGLPTTAFSADETHWASGYLENLSNYGIMRGDLNGNMEPDRYITRAEFVSMLNRAFGYTQYQRGNLPFNDITGEEWYADDVAIAYDMGYFSGTSRNLAQADDSLTREQAVSLICRNLKLEESAGENLDFTDSRTFSSWSRGAIGAGAEKGFVSGYTDGTFRPFNNITRGEAAKLISDVIGVLISNGGNHSYGMVNGNVTITNSSTTLHDTVVNGDLYITAGVGTGYVNLTNVTVLGEVIISGGGASNAGQNSINFEDCYVNRLVIDGEPDRVVSVDALGNTQIMTTVVKTDAYLEDYCNARNEGFVETQLSGEPETTLTLAGEFDTVSILKPENYLVVGRGSIRNLIVDEDAPYSEVTIDRNAYISSASLDAPCLIRGLGDLGDVTINASDVEVEMLPDTIVIRPGLTATINGTEMTSQDAEESSASPRILAGYPLEDEMGPTRGTFLFSTNKPGAIYWAVTREDDGDLNRDELLKPNNVKNIVSSGTTRVTNSSEEYTVTVTRLEVDTEYIISAVLQDERGDVSSVKTESFVTEDNIQPAFLNGYPSVSSQNSTSLDIVVNPNKRCTVYWAVLPQGSVAPTIEELKNDRLTGELDSGEERRCQKNIERDFTANGLSEEVRYDIYLVASDGENDSRLVKLTASTKDTTPPSFAEGYPMQDRAADNSVNVRVKTDEDCTVYYVACVRGTVFPAPVPPSTEIPSLDSPEGINAIITANNTEINGRANISGNEDEIITIRRLEPETSYDVYMVAQDSDGNASAGVKITVRTTDVIPPTATQEFTDETNDMPRVESDIRIVFSEEVLDSSTYEPLTVETLAEHVTLYSFTDNGEENVVDIDYDQAQIGIDDEGKTYILFPSESLNLNSGERYQFELNNIVDTSNNRMDNETRLESFMTLPPQVQLSRTETPQNMDITFSLQPQAIKTSDAILFDMIFESDTTVEFELYEKDETGVFQKYAYNPLIMEGSAMTLHYIDDRMSNGYDDYVFEPFNELKEREFGIRFVGVEGNAVRDSWNTTIQIDVKCVIGSKTVLSSLAGNPIGGFDTAIQNGAMQVNYPAEFQVSASFTDTVIPSFIDGYPILEAQGEVASEFGQIGDTLIRPLVMTDKAAQFYYLVAPTGTVREPVNALQIMSGALNPNGGVTGSAAINSGYVEVPVLIEGLVPETTYDFFYFLKGTPPEPSQVYKKTFTTLKVAPPVLTLQVIERGEDSATIRIVSDKNATIDWMLLPSLQCQNWFTTDEDGNKVLTMSEERVAEIIRNGRENTVYRPVDFGTVTTRYDSNEMRYYAEVSVSGLERDIYYTFFAVAKSTLSSGETNVGGDSKIAFEDDITPADVTAPSVEVTTVIRNGSDSQAGKSYRGTVMITFSEEIYYIPSENEAMVPLTADFFANNLVTTAGGDDDVSVTLDTYTTTRVGDDGERGLKSITLTFKNILHNDTIFFPYQLCDRNGNIAGMLRLTFTDMEAGGTGRRDSFWQYAFVLENQ